MSKQERRRLSREFKLSAVNRLEAGGRRTGSAQGAGPAQQGGCPGDGRGMGAAGQEQ